MSRMILKERGNFRLNHQENCLLRATLLEKSQALSAWKDRQSGDLLDHLDKNILRLMPLVYQNLSSLLPDDPLMKRCQGIYQFNLYKNHTLLRSMAHLIKFLHIHGIRTMVLRGAALILEHYQDFGLRQLEDFDILIPGDRVEQALKLLSGKGWKSVFPLTKDFSIHNYSLLLNDAYRHAIDLHWHALPEAGHKEVDDLFWSGAEQTSIHNIKTLILNPTDLLFQICTHEAIGGGTHFIQWIADAVILLRTHGKIDWNRLADLARRMKMVLLLKDTLRHLSENYDVTIPSDFFADLESSALSLNERLEHYTRMGRPSLSARALWIWFQHSRISGTSGPWQKLRRFPGYLKNRWNIGRGIRRINEA